MEISKKFPYAFYILGLSSFNPTTKNIFNNCQKLPAMILFIFVLIFTLAACAAQYFLYSHKQIFKTFTEFLFIFTKTITCIAVIAHSFCPKSNTIELWQKFQSIEKLYQIQFNKTLHYKIFNQLYFRDVYIIFGIHLVQIALKLKLCLGLNDVMLKSTFSALISVVLASNCHILFYVKLLAHIMKLTNKQFRHSNNMSALRFAAWNQQHFIDKFHRFKQMHYLCWNICEKINQHFGWILVTLIVQNSIDIVHTVYWIVLYTDGEGLWGKYKILRKY